MLNLGSNNQSLNFFIGSDGNYLTQRNETFDPFDNDYIEFRAFRWNRQVDNRYPGYLVLEEDPDYELEHCPEEKYNALVNPGIRKFFPMALCFKDPDRVDI